MCYGCIRKRNQSNHHRQRINKRTIQMPFSLSNFDWEIKWHQSISVCNSVHILTQFSSLSLCVNMHESILFNVCVCFLFLVSFLFLFWMEIEINELIWIEMNLQSTYVGVFGAFIVMIIISVCFSFRAGINSHSHNIRHTVLCSCHMCKYPIICVPLPEILYLGSICSRNKQLLSKYLLLRCHAAQNSISGLTDIIASNCFVLWLRFVQPPISFTAYTYSVTKRR